jgi:hypothetical protein
MTSLKKYYCSHVVLTSYDDSPTGGTPRIPVYLTSDIDVILANAEHVALLLKSYIAMRTHPSVLAHDPDYVTAQRLIDALKGVQP